MKGWKEIASYDRLHQAELRKSILETNGIRAVIINEKDSAFLLGDIQLFVEEENLEKARFILEEFHGWTRINAFSRKEPVENLKQVLEKNEIECKLVQSLISGYFVIQYELYVKNEDVERVRFFTNEMQGWKKVDFFSSERQATLRIDIFNQEGINAIALKKRDANFNVQEIELYVSPEQYEIAFNISRGKKLDNWELLQTFDNLKKATIREDLLFNHDIDCIIIKHRNESAVIESVSLYIRKKDEIQANELIAAHQNWTKIAAFGNIYQAEYYKSILEENNIKVVILNERDRTFLVGEIELYVNDEEIEQAKEILDDFKQAKIENEREYSE